MARMRWTEELKAEVAKRIRWGFTAAEVAEHIGGTRQSVNWAVRHFDLVSKEELLRLKADRCRKVNRSAEMREKISRARKTAWKDPAYRRRMTALLRAYGERSGHSKRFVDMVRAHHAQSRGFSIPEHLREEYRRLTKNKGLTPREAGEVLGLLSRQSISPVEARAA